MKLSNNSSFVISIFAILKFEIQIVLHFVVPNFDPHPFRQHKNGTGSQFSLDDEWVLIIWMDFKQIDLLFVENLNGSKEIFYWKKNWLHYLKLIKSCRLMPQQCISCYRSTLTQSMLPYAIPPFLNSQTISHDMSCVAVAESTRK